MLTVIIGVSWRGRPRRGDTSGGTSNCTRVVPDGTEASNMRGLDEYA